MTTEQQCEIYRQETIRWSDAVKRLTVERDAALKALKEEKEYAESLAKDICEMEDALGFKQDCTDKDGAFVPTKGPWKERVRDLIAKEGELGDVLKALSELKECLMLSQHIVETELGEDSNAAKSIRHVLGMESRPEHLPPQERQENPKDDMPA